MMRDKSFSLPESSADMELENAQPAYYPMHNAYEPRRMSRWLINFDDIQQGEEVAIFPQSSLSKIPHMQRNPRQYLEIDLARSCYVSDEKESKIEAEADAHTQKAKKWALAWGLQLQKIKKRQHLRNLRKNGHKRIAQKPPCPTMHKTKKAQVFGALIGRKLFSTGNIADFKELNVRQRLAKYQDTLELKAPDNPQEAPMIQEAPMAQQVPMIQLPDPAVLTTDLQTHCIDSLPNEHARSLLRTSAIELLPPTHVEIWREAQRHFWRHNVFVVDARHIKAVLNGFNARIKSYIGMLQVDLEALDDSDNLTRPNTSHVDSNSGQSLQAIRQQNKDLRRLMQECYNLTWVRIHVHTEWMGDQIQELAQAHRKCRKVSRCRHIRRYEELYMNTQRRVEHLTWMFYKSLKCKEESVFFDVEQLGLNGITRIFEVQIDHKKLDKVDKKIKAVTARKRLKSLT